MKAFVKRVLISLALIALGLYAESSSGARSGTATRAMVAACHSSSTEIGLKILRDGGNAVDAFVAATLGDYVASPGLTSLAGPLGLLYYDSATQHVHQLSAEYRTPNSPDGQYRVGAPAGQAVLIPGAIAGLETLHRRFGRLSWREVVNPARELAENGFAIDDLYAVLLRLRAESLRKSPYASRTYFRADGSPLRSGDWLKLPEVAATLDQLARAGARHFYEGEWAEAMVSAVGALGGKMSLDDLREYRPRWVEPLVGTYRGKTIFVPGSPVSGGARLLLSLQILEQYELPRLGHWTERPELLEKLIRVSRSVMAEPWLQDQASLADMDFLRKKLDGSLARSLFLSIEGTGSPPAPVPAAAAGHSYHVVVVDEDGNVITGTNTINSIPFGEPIQFVGGVPLNSSGVAYIGAKPGSYVSLPFTNHIVFDGGQPSLASGVFGTSLFPADFQLLSNVIDYGLSVEEAVLRPRFGTYQIDYINHWPPKIDANRTFLDSRFSADVRAFLEQRGISTTDQMGDTGFGVLIQIDRANGGLSGMTPELLNGSAQGY